jgi:hypothetical protein
MWLEMVKLLKNESRFLAGFKSQEVDLVVRRINQGNALNILRMILATAGEPDIEPGPKGDVSERSRNAVDTVKHNYESY